MENIQQGPEIDNKKCYNCGKVFKKLIDIERHKNRKTPCLIREVAPEHINNPNRCIFCNKIFAQRQTLTRHYKICKIKNGGMEVLADKVRYEQEIRILKEKVAGMVEKTEMQRQMDERIEMQNAMQKQIDEFKKQLAHYTINNNTNINKTNCNNTNITINNYLQPETKYLQDDFLRLFNEHLVQTPMALVPLVWFNPAHPENFSLYLVNKCSKEVLTYDGKRWVSKRADEVSKELRSRTYDLTQEMLVPVKHLLHAFRMAVPEQLQLNLANEDVMKLECQKIYEQVSNNRDLIKPFTNTQETV